MTDDVPNRSSNPQTWLSDYADMLMERVRCTETSRADRRAAQQRVDDIRAYLAHETPAEPKAGDEVVVTIPLSMGQPREGWKIQRIERPVYVYLEHPNGSLVSLLPGQFAVKAEANAHCHGCGQDYAAAKSHVCPATTWNVASNGTKNDMAVEAGLIRPSAFDRDLPCWHELPQTWRDRLTQNGFSNEEQK